MQYQTRTIPAVTETRIITTTQEVEVSPAQRVVEVQFTEAEASFIMNILGTRNIHDEDPGLNDFQYRLYQAIEKSFPGIQQSRVKLYSHGREQQRYKAWNEYRQKHGIK